MRSARVLCVGVAVAALFAGCDYEGGGKDDFVTKGNAVCESSGSTVMPALEELKAEGLPTTSDMRGFVGDVAAPALQKRVDELRQLDPPSDDRGTVNDIIRALQTGINEVRSDPNKLLDGDPFLEANADARVYGLTSCVLRAKL